MKKGFILITLILILTGCATTYNPATQRQEIVLIGDSQEISIGKSMTQEVKKQYKLNNDQAALRRINTIGQKLISVCDRKDIPYNFFVIEDKEINAFALPGGYIYVYTGLLNISTDDELAGVLAHEIGHIAARHPVKKIEVTLGYQILAGLISNNDIQKIATLGFNIINLGYSREDERLADKLSVRYSYLANFNPQGTISMFKKIQRESQKQGKKQGPIFLSSHPPIEERIKNIEEEIMALKGIKNQENSPNSNNLTKVNVNTQPKTVANQLPEINPPKQEITDNTNQRFCAKCKKNYPSGYRYCPVDGLKLN